MQVFRYRCNWYAISVLAGMVLAPYLPAQPSGMRAAGARERATQQLAIHTAARRFWDLLPELSSPPDERLATLREQLREAMLEDPAAHRQQVDSKDLARTLAIELQHAWIEAQRQQILQEARNQSPLPIRDEDLDVALSERGSQRLVAEMAIFVERVFPAQFQSARALAVAGMRERLDRRVSQPSFDALDARLLELGQGGFLGRPWETAAEQGLRDWLAPYVGLADMPLFEEVEAYARDLARQEADRIRNQYLQQAETAEHKLEAPAILPLRLGSEIARGIVTQVTNVFDGPLFSGVRQHIVHVAATAEDERFRDAVKGTPLIAIQEKVLVDQMHADWSAHRRTDASRKLFLNYYHEALILPVVAAYAEGLENASAPFTALLRDAETASGAAFAERVTDALDALFPTVRESLARSQWSTKGKAIDALQTLPDAVLAAVVERNGQDWRQLDLALEWFAVLEIDLLPEDVDRSLLLEENEIRLLSRINALIRAGFDAVQAQVSLLRELEGERLARLQEEVRAGRTYEALYADWRKALVDAWGEQAGAHPGYAGLTSPAEEALDRAVRQFFDTVRQTVEEKPVEDAIETVDSEEEPTEAESEDIVEPQEVVAEKDASPDEAEETDDETGDGAGAAASMDADVGSRVAPDILLILRGDDEMRVQVMLQVRSRDAGEVWEMDIRDPEASAQALFDKIAPILAGLAEDQFASPSRFLGIWRRQPSPLHFYTVVESGAVRHRMSLLLHEKIEDYLRRQVASEHPVSLRWETGLYP